MAEERQILHSGGCQCGAVRYALYAEPYGTHICHCRMCQKAFGGFFGSLVTCGAATWTRGGPKWFASSDGASRGFCENCGTPLAYETKYGLELAIGAFDDPGKVAPVIQVNPRDKLALFDTLTGLPVKISQPDGEWEQFMAGLTSYQHPDRDTETWPPAE